MSIGSMNNSNAPAALRWGLLLPVIGLVLGLVIAVFAVAWVAADAQDRQADNAMRHTVSSVISGNRHELGGWASDYAYWDEFVEKAVVEPDPIWIDDNVGLYAQENLNVDVTLLVDGSNEPYVVSISEDLSLKEPLVQLPVGLVSLIQSARQNSGPIDKRPAAQEGYVRIGGHVFMAAAAVARRENDNALPVRMGGPVVLVYLRRIDDEMLAEFADDYMIRDLEIVDPTPDRPTGLKLLGLEDEVVAQLVWVNARPGTKFLQDLTVPMLIILVIAAVLVAWIITRVRAAVVQFMAAHEVLNRQAEALRLARDDADRANRAKTEFLAQMSHDLRTPLNAILGFSEVIALQSFGSDAAAADRYRDYARQIHAGGDHLRSLIDSILDVARLDAGRYELHTEPVDLDGAVGTCLSLLHDMVTAKALTVTAPPSDLTVRMDHGALEQILINLIGNAVKYTEPGGTITIAAERTPDGVAVSVRDTGRGMSKSDVDTAFELFTRGAGGMGADTEEGAGIGLSIVKRLVDLHEGRVWIDSARGDGTTVTFVLPDSSTPTAPEDESPSIS
ncbi:MAG: ATP-binding protein [Thalassobaculaceae bacterium]|nr:ATP-binding protein [Thalassobaculaceae bacterium]